VAWGAVQAPGGSQLEKPAYAFPASIARNGAFVGAIRSSGAYIVALPETCNAHQAQVMSVRLKISRVYAPHPTSYALDFFESGLAPLFCFPIRRSSNFTVFFDTDV